MKKIYITIIVGIFLLGVITASVISFSQYSKVSEKTEIKTEGVCKEKVCEKNTPKTLSLENSGLQIDVLRDSKNNKEVLHIYPK